MEKYIIDPVFGFIKVPSGLLLDIIKHPLFQRLARIQQLGLSSTVYPGAVHTRKMHSLGAFHLMTEAINTLRGKGVFIFDSEAEAAEAAILMHDIGHGPFSHVLEQTLIKGISHEEITQCIMQQINQEMNGALNLAISIFTGEYPKPFLHQLISSQLDVDRLDYLCRDSFFTGVAEGNIGPQRIISMMNVVDERLVIEEKGVYSVESYLIARRLMYWQVYLHKTVVASEQLLRNILCRAHHLAAQGVDIPATPALAFFLQHDITRQDFADNDLVLRRYEELDDTDIWAAVKTWTNHPDKILSMLARDFIARRPFVMEILPEPVSADHLASLQTQLAQRYQVSEEDAAYLMAHGILSNPLYKPAGGRIDIIGKDGACHDLLSVSHLIHGDTGDTTENKYYVATRRG